jgi:hypothetical protein
MGRIVVARTIGDSCSIYVIPPIPFAPIVISICTTRSTCCHVLLLLLWTREAWDVGWMEVRRDFSAIFRSHWLMVVIGMEVRGTAQRTVERLLLLLSRRIRWLLGYVLSLKISAIAAILGIEQCLDLVYEPYSSYSSSCR